MRKHFLILMLMTLLPFYGWAEWQEAPTAIDGIVYTGANQPLINAGTPEEGKTAIYAVVAHSAAAPAAAAYGTAIPQEDDAATYDVYYTEAANATAPTESEIAAALHLEVTIGQASNAITSLTLANWAWEATATAHNPVIAATFGAATVSYQYSSDNSTWGNTVPSEIGNYYLKATIAATSNYASAEATTQFSITKADIVADDFTAPAKTTPTYTGLAQALHTAGSMTNNYGTIQFATSATAAEADWGTTPITGVNAGGYSVYYRIKGNAQHNDYPATLIEDTKIAQINLTISAASRTVSYTGTALANSEFYTISTGALIEADADNTALKNSLVSVGWVGSETQPVNANANGWQFALTAGNPQNYKVTIGTASGSLVITKQNLKAIVSNISNYTYGDQLYSTSNFITTYKTMADAAISVTPTSISYTVLRTSDNQNYFVLDAETGEPTATVKGDVGTYVVTPVVEFDNYKVEAANITTKEFTVSKKTLNASWISLSATAFEYDGQANTHMPTVTVANNVSYPNGKATLVAGTDYVLTEPDDKTNVGEKIITISAQGNYKNPTAGANTKKYNITPAALTIVVKNGNKPWDGQAIADVTATSATLDNYATIYNDLDEAYDEVFKNGDGTNYPEFEVVKKNVGTVAEPVYDNTYAGVYVYTAKGYTARNYDVMVSNGTFTIGAPSITIKAKDDDKKYGEDDPAAFDYEVYIGDAENPVDDADRAIYVQTAPTSITRANATQNTVGEYAITCSQDAVLTTNYATAEVTYLPGTFTINKAQLRILADAKSKVYDGVEPAASTLTYTAIGLQYNDAVTSVKLVKDAGTDVGKYDITASEAVVANADQYDIKYQKAKYEITRRRLTKIEIADQAITKQDDNTEPSRTAAIATLDKTKVTFTADGYELTAADYQKLQGEFNFTLIASANVSVATFNAETGVNTPINNAIKIAYANAETKFTNFSLPISSGTTEINLGGNAVDNKYLLGKLSVYQVVAGDMVFDDSETDEGETVAELIATYAGQNIPSVKVKLNRNQVLATTNCNWAAEKWNTMVLPFDVTIRELSAQLGYAIVNVVDADHTSANNVAFKLQMSGTIKANTPFVVKTDVAVPNETTLSFANKTIVNATPTVDAGQGYEFVGRYTTLTLGGVENDHSKLSFLRGNGEKWAHIGANSANTWNIVPMAAYIDLTPANDAREVTFTMQEADGSTTVIRNISNEAAARLNAEGWYTINGMKLDNAPVEKGVYIHNGKKVVLK